MSVTVTEFKMNLGKYQLLSAKQDIYITQCGKVVAKLTKPYQSRVEIAESLFGVLPQLTTFDESR